MYEKPKKKKTNIWIQKQTKLNKIRIAYGRQLDGNAVMHLDDVSFVQLKHLRALRLEGNMLQHVPTEALTGLPTLEILWVFRIIVIFFPHAFTFFLLALSLFFSLSFPHTFLCLSVLSQLFSKF